MEINRHPPSVGMFDHPLGVGLYHFAPHSGREQHVLVAAPIVGKGDDIHTGIAQSERNRPQRYSAAGDVIDTDERAMVHQALADSTAGGIGPEVMAQRVYDAIVDKRFYILSEEAWRDTANTRLDDVRAGRNPTFAPPVG